MLVAELAGSGIDFDEFVRAFALDLVVAVNRDVDLVAEPLNRVDVLRIVEFDVFDTAVRVDDLNALPAADDETAVSRRDHVIEVEFLALLGHDLDFLIILRARLGIVAQLAVVLVAGLLVVAVDTDRRPEAAVLREGHRLEVRAAVFGILVHVERDLLAGRAVKVDRQQKLPRLIGFFIVEIALGVDGIPGGEDAVDVEVRIVRILLGELQRALLEDVGYLRLLFLSAGRESRRSEQQRRAKGDYAFEFHSFFLSISHCFRAYFFR